MSQGDLGTLVPAETSGTELASRLRTWRDALHTQHSGATRPSYAQPGMMWVDTSGNPWVRKLWTGNADVEIDAINPTTGAVTSRAGIADDSVTFAKLQNIAPGVFGRTAAGTGDGSLISFAALYAQIAGASPWPTENNYIRVPVSVGGNVVNMVFQWGILRSAAAGDAQVVFPTTFPNAVLFGTGVCDAVDGPSVALAVFVHNVLTSGMVVNRRVISGGAVAGANQDVRWFALGW